MGVKKLHKSLEELYNSFNPIEPLKYKVLAKDLANSVIAIDASLWMYQGKCAILGTNGGIKNSVGEDVSVIVSMLNRILYLLKCNIKPIFVFDGKPPVFKSNILLQRKESKLKAITKLENKDYLTEEEKNKLYQKTCHLTKSDIDLFKELLNLLGIPYIDAPTEADCQCAYLYRAGIVDYIISEDSDIVVFGGNKIIKEFKASTTEVEVFDMDIFYTNTGLERTDVIDIALLLGCDYFNGIKGIGVKKIHKLLHNKEPLFAKENITPQIQEIINYFLKPEVKKNITYHMNDIKFNELRLFLLNRIELPTVKVLKVITTLKFTSR